MAALGLLAGVGIPHGEFSRKRLVGSCFEDQIGLKRVLFCFV